MRRRRKKPATVKWGKRRKATFYVVYLGLFGLLATGVLWVIIYAPIFRVDKVELLGQRAISEEDMLTFLRSSVPSDVWGHFLGSRNILTWPESFSEEDIRFLPRAKNITISKDYGKRRVEVRVSERSPEMIWCAERIGRCAWLDKDNIVIATAPHSTGPLVPVILDNSSDVSLVLGSAPVSEEVLDNLDSVLRVLSEASLFPSRVEIREEDLPEVRIVSAVSPDLYFSLRFPAHNTLAAIESLRERGEFSSLEYVDFRVENRAYYQ